MDRLKKSGAFYIFAENGPWKILHRTVNIISATDGHTTRTFYKLPTGEFTSQRLIPTKKKYRRRNGYYEPDPKHGRITITGYYPLFYASDGHAVFMSAPTGDRRRGADKPRKPVTTTRFVYSFVDVRQQIIKKHEIELGKKIKRERERLKPLVFMKSCINCGTAFEAFNERQVYCSSKCSTHVWRQRVADLQEYTGIDRYDDLMTIPPEREETERLFIENEKEIEKYALAFMDKFTARDFPKSFDLGNVRIVLNRMCRAGKIRWRGIDKRWSEKRYEV